MEQQRPEPAKQPTVHMSDAVKCFEKELPEPKLARPDCALPAIRAMGRRDLRTARHACRRFDFSHDLLIGEQVACDLLQTRVTQVAPACASDAERHTVARWIVRANLQEARPLQIEGRFFPRATRATPRERLHERCEVITRLSGA